MFTRCSSSGATRESPAGSDDSISVDNLRRFIRLNLGKWDGSFHGNLLHKMSTKFSASSYGEDDLISLIQRFILNNLNRAHRCLDVMTSLSGRSTKLKRLIFSLLTNISSMQIAFFPEEKTFALRYQTAGMLETVLRQGVLGEDDTDEEFPKNLKLSSRRPSVVGENCLYSQQRDARVRVLHIMDPQACTTGNLATFDGVYQLTLLPSGMYMGYRQI